MADQLTTIVDLQETLTELGTAETLLAGIPDWMQELHDEHSERKAVIDSLEVEVEEAAQANRAAESQIADLREKVKHFQEQIGMVRNQREYGAILQEIDTVKQQIQQFEETALGAMEQQEEANQRLSQEREGFQELDARYSTELEKWEAQKPDVAKNAEDLRSRIEVLKEQVPRGTLALFERIMARHQGQALAPIQQVDRGPKLQQMWHCGACNHRVRPQAVVTVQTQGTIEFCDSCKRILYLAEESG